MYPATSNLRNPGLTGDNAMTLAAARGGAKIKQLGKVDRTAIRCDLGFIRCYSLCKEEQDRMTSALSYG